MKSSLQWVSDVWARIDRVSDDVAHGQTIWWWLALAFFGVGDLLTTGVAISFGSVGEANPFVRYSIETFGFGGFVGLKLLALALSYAAWRAVGSPNNVGVPLALSVLGFGFTTWNLVVVAGALVA